MSPLCTGNAPHDKHTVFVDSQDLVSQFAGMVAALSSSADKAATKFDEQRAAAKSVSAAMKDALTSMRNAAALAEQLQSKYVEQTLMMDAATGSIIEDWNCARTSDWEVWFTVSRYVQCAVAFIMHALGRSSPKITLISRCSKCHCAVTAYACAVVGPAMVMPGACVGCSPQTSLNNWRQLLVYCLPALGRPSNEL